MADENDEKVNAARRRLLRIAIYTPPAILGGVALSQMAGCQGVSCAPQVCQPNNSCGPNACNPAINPCNPQNCNPNT
jgi:hypothetical protein